MFRARTIAITTAILIAATPLLAGDWLQWGGPRGDFRVETGGKLAESWPEEGPPVLWQRPLGEGYSAILYRADRLYTVYRDKTSGDEVVIALTAGDGKTLWEHRDRPAAWPDMTPQFGRGPNATPLIVGDRIVAIGISGKVRCLALADGELLWSVDLAAEYGRRERVEEYGYSASPLSYQGKVLVQVGGDDHAVIALEPKDGSVAWKSAPGGISYAPASIVHLAGRDQFLYFEPEGIVALDPASGKTLWRHSIPVSNGNHLTHAVQCDATHLWVGSQFLDAGGRLIEITPGEGGLQVEEHWQLRRLRASHWTMVRLGEVIYGSTGGNSTSFFTAFNWKTGETIWRERGIHKSQLLYADGKALSLDEDGELVLARLSPKGMERLASAQVTGSVSWTLPTLIGTTLYVRDTKQILALDLGLPKP